MPDYKAMYYHLAGRIAGTVEALEAITGKLKLAQQATEEMLLYDDDDADNTQE